MTRARSPRQLLLLGAVAVLVVFVASRKWVPSTEKGSAGSRSAGEEPISGTLEEMPEEVPPLQFYGKIPDFRFIDRSGSEIARADLEGKVWVADFIFTSCSGICPMMTARMETLQTKLDGVADVRFVSFSVDPERDTPEKLASYADTYGAKKDRWFFLTGEQEKIFSLCKEAFKLGVRVIPPGELSEGEDPILHSNRFVLVDGESEIRGYYDGTLRETASLLASDIRELLRRQETP